jgi:hypothetical protein
MQVYNQMKPAGPMTAAHKHLGVVMVAIRMDASCADGACCGVGDAAGGAAELVAVSSQPPPSSSSWSPRNSMSTSARERVISHIQRLRV